LSEQIAPARGRAAAVGSTVVLKAAMAVSGLIMVLYLLAHMYGNLKVFSGQAAFDDYARHLRTIGEPFLPYSGALWIVRVVLLASVLVHVYAAIVLWRRARAATAGRGGQRYESRKARRGVQRTYASFTLRWGGVVIALFVVFHVLNLSTRSTPAAPPAARTNAWWGPFRCGGSWRATRSRCWPWACICGTGSGARSPTSAATPAWPGAGI